MLSSCESLSRYEQKNMKNLVPQVIATSIVASFHIVVGISLVYSSILLPQLKMVDSEIVVTKTQDGWISSVIAIVIPFSGLTCGFLMDTLGRLNVIKLALLPALIGWIIIATAQNVTMIIVGRIITGIAAAWGTSPAMVYITEIARADVRGSLISFAPTYTSLGMVLAYLQGWCMHWRTVAWLCLGYAIVPFILIQFLHESPAWLVSKNRLDAAQKSLTWFNKHQPQPGNKIVSFAELQLNMMVKEQDDKRKAEEGVKRGFRNNMSKLLKPTGYKPLLLLIGLFVFQQFSGIYITLFYSVDFFQEVGNKVDPHLASVLTGLVRFIMSMVNVYMLKAFSRRFLLVLGATSMVLSMCVSGCATYFIKHDPVALSWIAIIAITFYVITSMISLLSIPWIMTAEVFPIEIRGVAHSIVYSTAYILMFAAVQSYNHLKLVFNGVAGLQWFFAVISLLGLLFGYVFLPETRGAKLSYIQEYFEYNWIYLGGVKTRKSVEAQNAKAQEMEVMNGRR